MTTANDLLDLDDLGIDLTVEYEDWKPTPHGLFLAKVLVERNLVEELEVLELGVGTGIHTILLKRQRPKRIVATEITEERLESARQNLLANGVEEGVEYVVADWLDAPGVFDAIVTNPPFCKSGKRNRRYFIDDLILNSHKRLRDGGLLIFIQSSMADIGKTKRRLAENGYDVEIAAQIKHPFRDYYYDDEAFMREIQEVPNSFEVYNGREWETLYVVKARLTPQSPCPMNHSLPTA